MRHSHNTDVLWATFSELPETAKADALKLLIPNQFGYDLLDLAQDRQTTPEVLDHLSRHRSARIRAAVASNHGTPLSTLDALRSDTAKSVRKAAESHWVWRHVLLEPDNIPACQPQLVASIRHVNTTTYQNKRRRVLSTLLREPTWQADPTFVRWLYNESLLRHGGIVKTAGADAVLASILKGLPNYDTAHAVDQLADIVTAPELHHAISTNQDDYAQHAHRALGPHWATKALDIYDDSLPAWWTRVGHPQCSDQVLLQALSSTNDTLVSLAAANARNREHLTQDILAVISRRHTDTYYPAWDAAAALPESALLDLPLNMLLEAPYWEESATPRSLTRALFAREAGHAAHTNPGAWEILLELSDEHQGTCREMLAALRHL